MKKALTIFQILVRATGTVVLILGLLFWAGLDPNLIKIHVVIGAALVISLLGLVFLAVRFHVAAGLIVLMIGWTVVLPVLGLTQAQILLGPAHWVIHIVHLLVGIGALGQAEMLGGRIKENIEEEASKVHRRPTRKVRVSD
jgi:hypothetical protein